MVLYGKGRKQQRERHSATTGAVVLVYEEVKKVLQNLNIPIQKLVGLVRGETPSMFRRNTGVSSLTSQFDNTTLLHTSKKSLCEIPENDECCYCCYKTR
jgi:hypothetical protein